MYSADAFDLLSTTVLLLNSAGEVVEANAAAEVMFGRSRRNLLGQPAAFLFDRDKALAHSIQQACRGEVADCRQFARVRRGVETVEVAVTSVALSQPLWSALIEIKDLEQRVLVDRSSRLVDEIDTQHELLRNLAHEVKNPLGGLRGAAQLLESELPDPALREYTSVIISEADRLQALVDRLAAPQRMPVQWQAVNIHEICERVCALVRAEFREVALLRDYDASMPEFRADPARVMQALLNIVRNAAQVMTGFHPTQSPHITIKTRIARQVLLRHKQHRLAAVVTVIDNGPGVPEILKERIFHPLVTGRDGGTGLGLSLAQDFIQQHGGVIEFESQPGHTEFRLQLPMEPF
ncbi:MAG: nitrogen regulation protein NR(II) [Burkholderiaceae bacterium]|nr:nitrogen regulation protein NR(II) [Burkholderiaceae bacterium]